jgi:hypothetical protein
VNAVVVAKTRGLFCIDDNGDPENDKIYGGFLMTWRVELD